MRIRKKEVEKRDEEYRQSRIVEDNNQVHPNSPDFLKKVIMMEEPDLPTEKSSTNSFQIQPSLSSFFR